jgi:hypothetical protein
MSGKDPAGRVYTPTMPLAGSDGLFEATSKEGGLPLVWADETKHANGFTLKAMISPSP